MGIQALIDTQVLTVTGSTGDVMTVQADGSYLAETPAGASPGGSSGEIQYNNAGAFGGTVAVVYAGSGSHLSVTAQAATDVPVTVQGAVSQTANLTEWKDSAGTLVTHIDSVGRLSFGPKPVYITSTNGNVDIHANNGVGNTYTFNLGVTGQFICNSVSCDYVVMGGSVTVLSRSGTVVKVANNTGEIQLAPAGTTMLTVDLNATAGETRMLLYDVDAAALVRVSVGAADSGGTGYKILRVPN